MAPDTSNPKVLIVTAEYYEDLAGRLEQGAVELLLQAGCKKDHILMRRVPGCWELPLAVRRLIRSHSPDAVVALGVLIRGETDHYEHIARETCAGLMRVSLDEDVYVALGVLTCTNHLQAEKRCNMHQSKTNKGREAARAVLHVLSGDQR